MDNKSRKGEYAYVVLEKGGKPSYYKTKKGLTKNDYLNTKKYGIIVKQKGAYKKKSIDKYIEKIKKGKKIEDLIQKGITTFNLENAQRVTPYGIRSAYYGLLTNKQNKFKGALVKDKKMAEILSKTENVKKFSKRIEYKVSIIGQNDEELATLISAHKGKTLEEVIIDVKKNIKVGMEIRGTYNFANLQEYNMTKKNDGRVKSFSISMILRKG